MIGLRRGTVEIVKHQDHWHAAFQRERQSILALAGDLVADIQHVGSTAVPGLAAKPIIDIAAALRSPSMFAELSRELIGVGWIHRGDKGKAGGHLFVRESGREFRTHHLHVVDVDSAQWVNYLRFRDLFIANDAVRLEYAGRKQELQSHYSRDRRSYTAAKADFIAATLAVSSKRTPQPCRADQAGS